MNVRSVRKRFQAESARVSPVLARTERVRSIRFDREIGKRARRSRVRLGGNRRSRAFGPESIVPSERRIARRSAVPSRAFEPKGSTAEDAKRRVPLRIHEPVLEALAADSETASPRALLPEAASPIGVTPRPIPHERLESPLATLSASRSPRRIVAGGPGGGPRRRRRSRRRVCPRE